MRVRRALLPALVAIVVGASCVLVATRDQRAGAAGNDVYPHLARNVAAPGYERLAETTAELSDSVAALCASPGSENLAAAQEAWAGAWRAWNRLPVFRFGPGFNASRLSFPADPTKIDLVSAGGVPMVGPPFTLESVGLTGADIRGLEAVEYLLFGPDPTPNECAYALAAAQIVAGHGRDLELGWNHGRAGQPAIVGELADPKRAISFANTQAALDLVVNGMLKASSEAVLLTEEVLMPKPGRARATIHTGDRVQDNLWAVQSAYFGSTGKRSGPGIEELVAKRSPAASTRTADAIRDAVAAARPLPERLSDAPPGELRRAYQAARKLYRLLETEVAAQLDVTINLTDTDGDS
jgi:predicted lipoprotein